MLYDFTSAEVGLCFNLCLLEICRFQDEQSRAFGTCSLSVAIRAGFKKPLFKKVLDSAKRHVIALIIQYGIDLGQCTIDV